MSSELWETNFVLHGFAAVQEHPAPGVSVWNCLLPRKGLKPLPGGKCVKGLPLIQVLHSIRRQRFTQHPEIFHFMSASAAMGEKQELSVRVGDERTGQHIWVEGLGNCTAAVAGKEPEVLLLIRVLKPCWTVSDGLLEKCSLLSLPASRFCA